MIILHKEYSTFWKEIYIIIMFWKVSLWYKNSKLLLPHFLNEKNYEIWILIKAMKYQNTRSERLSFSSSWELTFYVLSHVCQSGRNISFGIGRFVVCVYFDIRN